MKSIFKTMAVILLTMLALNSFAGNERPLIVKPYYYTTQTCFQECEPDEDPTGNNCWYVRITTTYSVNDWNQVTMIGRTRTESNSPCFMNRQSAEGNLMGDKKTKSEDEMIRESIYQQQREVQQNDKIVLHFLN